MRLWNNTREDSTILFSFLLVFFAATIWICLASIRGNSENKNIQTKTLVKEQYVVPLTEFVITYKDGHTSSAKATSIIYGPNDDKIYFLGQFHDTLQVIPQIIVDNIEEKNTHIKK